MGRTLAEIAQDLSAPREVRVKRTNQVDRVSQVPKVQLIYAFNGTGKTRLSTEFKKQIASKGDGNEGDASALKMLYYNAFTEDLFYWDNDLENDALPKLKIQPNSFTDWVLRDQGQDVNIISNFQRYVGRKLTPRFNEEYRTKGRDGKTYTVKAFSEVTFSFERGDNQPSDNIKISKGEESNFIWSVFYALLVQVVETLNITESVERATHDFDLLEYVFIDDPVSSLDDNHLIELAVDLAGLIRSSSSNLKFIVTTHSPLFYNVLYNELNTKVGHLLELLEDSTFSLTEKHGDSNRSFSYHLHLKQVIEQAIAENKVERFHFTLLRNLYEKTASFLGYRQWSELLPEDRQLYLNRVIQFTSHSTLSDEAVAEPTPQEKAVVKFLLDHLKKKEHGYWSEEPQNG